MENITVTIPAQEFSSEKYQCDNNQLCYLEEALIKAGYKNVEVWGNGFTIIGKKYFYPLNAFDANVLRSAFAKGESVIVTLYTEDI